MLVFFGVIVLVVIKVEFVISGFSGVYFVGVRYFGYWIFLMLLVETRWVLVVGERFVYVYYDGIDKVVYEYGFGEHYDVELVFVDCLVVDLFMLFFDDVALLVMVDYG